MTYAVFYDNGRPPLRNVAECDLPPAEDPTWAYVVPEADLAAEDDLFPTPSLRKEPPNGTA